MNLSGKFENKNFNLLFCRDDDFFLHKFWNGGHSLTTTLKNDDGGVCELARLPAQSPEDNWKTCNRKILTFSHKRQPNLSLSHTHTHTIFLVYSEVKKYDGRNLLSKLTSVKKRLWCIQTNYFSLNYAFHFFGMCKDLDFFFSLMQKWSFRHFSVWLAGSCLLCALQYIEGCSRFSKMKNLHFSFHTRFLISNI